MRTLIQYEWKDIFNNFNIFSQQIRCIFERGSAGCTKTKIYYNYGRRGRGRRVATAGLLASLSTSGDWGGTGGRYAEKPPPRAPIRRAALYHRRPSRGFKPPPFFRKKTISNTNKTVSKTKKNACGNTATVGANFYLYDHYYIIIRTWFYHLENWKSHSRACLDTFPSRLIRY